MRVLVTGGAGFIGSHLVERLVALGHEVRVLDNLSNGKPENLRPCFDHIDFRREDIRDKPAVVAAMRGIEVCFHEAALGSVPRSIKDPITSNDVNVTGTLNVLVAAKECKVRRVLYAGSSSAYGDTPSLPKRETMRTRPKSPYAVSKHTAEEYCRVFSQVYGLETVVLRYFNVFGPRQDPNGPYAAVIPRFIDAARTGQPPQVHGDGLQSRDFTYVANVVHANLLAMNAPSCVAGKLFNVGANKQYTLLDVLNAINKALGTSVQPAFGPEREGDVRHSRASYSAAQRAFGYRPIVSFERGIELTAEAFALPHPAFEKSRHNLRPVGDMLRKRA